MKTIPIYRGPVEGWKNLSVAGCRNERNEIALITKSNGVYIVSDSDNHFTNIFYRAMPQGLLPSTAAKRFRATPPGGTFVYGRHQKTFSILTDTELEEVIGDRKFVHYMGMCPERFFID